MTIFARSPSVNTTLSQWFNRFGWASMFVNMITLTWFFWGKYQQAFWLIRLTGCIAVSALILGIEFAALSVLFEPAVLDEFIGQNKQQNSISNAITTAGMVAVSFIAGAAFWYDWVINTSAFQLKTNDLDYQILAAVIVLISEIFFWVANVCEISGKRKPLPKTTNKPEPKE
ncbi:hypothetical protein [Calothrix sp. 336/3]|uniref:hypothetical protein n=1 Tax=Calothrix sp. 336/3 TaxID=1337936 RepID=UPI0004E30AEF|nr:hypothetical protein [Calothrix sp. 336/3]AKG21288.1 hypothetical protein IJ00_08215 [Calothrix sp. 336/3]